MCVYANKYTYICTYVNVSQCRDAHPYVPKSVCYYMQILCVNWYKGEINKFLIRTKSRSTSYKITQDNQSINQQWCFSDIIKTWNNRSLKQFFLCIKTNKKTKKKKSPVTVSNLKTQENNVYRNFIEIMTLMQNMIW